MRVVGFMFSGFPDTFTCQNALPDEVDLVRLLPVHVHLVLL